MKHARYCTPTIHSTVTPTLTQMKACTTTTTTTTTATAMTTVTAKVTTMVAKDRRRGSSPHPIA